MAGSCSCRSVSSGVRACQPFDSGKLGPDHRHSRWSNRAYGRFQARCDAGCGRGLRRGVLEGNRGSRRARPDLRFYERVFALARQIRSQHRGRDSNLAAAASGTFAATTFASNVARLKTLASAGVAAGRSVCLLGRAMRRMVEDSVMTGILADFPKTISPDEAKSVPREHLMLLVTGSQGEGRAASAALSRGKYQGWNCPRATPSCSRQRPFPATRGPCSAS